MMTAIATQEELDAFKNALEQLGSNLSCHVNTSLSKAHGIALIRGPANDGSGNDLRIFQDEWGHAVSGTDPAKANYIRFVVNGVAYYAPATYSDPGPQAESTGAIELSPTALDQVYPVSLITDYVTYETQAATNMNLLFLEHPKKTHQIGHLDVVVIQIDTRAPDGHLYANYRLRFQWNNNVYEIPCHTRLGGPPQPAQGMWLLANQRLRHNAASSSHDDEQEAAFYLRTPRSGTKPYTLSYQINAAIPTWNIDRNTVTLNSSTWNNMANTTPGWHGATTAEEVYYDISNPAILKLRADNGSDDSKPQCVVRAKYTNDYGATYSNYCFLRANDEDGSLLHGPDSDYDTYYTRIIGSPPIPR